MARHCFIAAVVLIVGLMASTICVSQSGAQQGQPTFNRITAPVKGVFRMFNQLVGGALEMESGGKTVYVKVDAKAKTSITGVAEPSFLAPQMMIKFDCVANANGEVKDPLTKLAIVEPSDVETPAFSVDDPNAVSLALKKPTKEELEVFKKYFVRGLITKVDGDEVTIKVPNATVKAKVAANAKIDVQSKQYQYVQPGDEVVVADGKEMQQPAPPKGAAAPTPPTPPKAPPKVGGKVQATVDPTARFVIADRLEVTAKTPLVGKKKPGAK